MKEDFLIPEKNIAHFVDEFCKRFSLEYVETPTDVLAKSITELSGDTLISDKTRGQLIALNRAYKITNAQMLTLLAKYIAEHKSQYK
jgi:hypothetical protein